MTNKKVKVEGLLELLEFIKAYTMALELEKEIIETDIEKYPTTTEEEEEALKGALRVNKFIKDEALKSLISISNEIYNREFGEEND